jgi:uncharacterized protein YecE (DUF72 family)
LSAISVEVPAWCIFDNTASGAAIENAVALWSRLGSARGTVPLASARQR